MIRRLFSRDASLPALPEARRVYAIGDIHGRLDLLDALLADLEVDNRRRGSAEVDVIFLGDLIDRGPDSAGVVRRAMQPLNWARTIVIRGNHEAALLDTLDGERSGVPQWLGNGGRAALRSWGIAEETIRTGTIDDIIAALRQHMPTNQRAWLARARQSVQIGDYYFVHAGVRPGVDLARQTLHDSLWIREEFLHSKRAHGAVVVHGHSVSEEVEERPNRIGIDTGAYASGRLTALGLEGTKRWFISTDTADIAAA